MQYNTYMPANTEPFRIYVPPADPRAKNAAAAVIRFVDGNQDMARIQAFLDRLVERGIIHPTHVQEYNADITSAELYFP